MAHPYWSSLQTFLQYFIFIYAAIIIGFYVLSDNVMFQPPAASYHDSANIIKIPVEGKKHISAVYLPHPHAKYTILYSHGNAEDLGTLLPLLKQFHEHGYAILAYDYQGYGTSDGKPSEKNTYQDILAAYHYLTQTQHVLAKNIIIYGRSIGTGPSTYLAANEPNKALILQSPFVSVYRAQTRLPLIPFDKYPTLSTLSKIAIPKLIIAGTADSIIPIWHAKKIAKQARGFTQTYWVQGADHNDILQTQPLYWSTITEFLNQVEKQEKTHE